jgi:hypothetical protein
MMLYDTSKKLNNIFIEWKSPKKKEGKDKVIQLRNIIIFNSITFFKNNIC